ncbi:hypothetical protein RDABS01_032187 [Bienertia sinuspersici]
MVDDLLEGWRRFKLTEEEEDEINLDYILDDEAMEIFREACRRCDLSEVKFKGYPFTWWNGREDQGSIEERLDRFLADTEWSVLFPWASVTHLDESLSDHLLILLKLNIQGTRNQRARNRRFCFENWWVEESSCTEVVREA